MCTRAWSTTYFKKQAASLGFKKSILSCSNTIHQQLFPALNRGIHKGDMAFELFAFPTRPAAGRSGIFHLPYPLLGKEGERGGSDKPDDK